MDLKKDPQKIVGDFKPDKPWRERTHEATKKAIANQEPEIQRYGGASKPFRLDTTKRMLAGNPNPLGEPSNQNRKFIKPMNATSNMTLRRGKFRVIKSVDLTIPPRNTIFVNNLSEKIKTTQLKKALEAVFKQFGEIVDIVAMKSIKRRGQAYISFETVQEAQKALDAMQGFPLFTKPLRIEFAHTNSDKIAKKLGDYKPRPPRPPRPTKKERKQIVLIKQAEEEQQRRRELEANPLTAPQKPIFQFVNNIPGPPSGNGMPPPPPKNVYGLAPPPPPPTANTNLPPNNILFIERLPEESNEIMVTVLFNKFSGFSEVRLVPGRPDIAFVEFNKISQATIAKNQLNNFKVTSTHAIKVTFARK